MKIFYTDHFVLPLPEKHRFPMLKYARLRARVSGAGLVKPENLRVPQPASDAQLRLAHSPEYVERVKTGQLSRQEIRRMGFPWSPALVERSRRSVGATIEACRTALVEDCAVNLAGGTHHAGYEAGQGFCVFNDTVVAARAMQAEGLARHILVIDCDVHQGNGTADITADDPTIFCFSIHGARNFPFIKATSNLDVSLPDETGDTAYLSALADGLTIAFEQASADLVIYLAGADPFVDDRLGRLALSKAGLARRDALVFEFCRAASLPVAVTMSGGYAPDIEDIVDIHFQTVSQAADYKLDDGRKTKDGRR